MEEHLDSVRAAALGFLEGALEQSGDRIAVLSFAGDTTIDQGFTTSPGQAERALAGLIANGLTALYDSIVQAVNFFEGVSGQGALVLFSDGHDESSRITLEQTTNAALRSGVSLHIVGLESSFADRDSRRVLEQLAEATGGSAYFLSSLEQIEATYAGILSDLRSRYLIAYQSNSVRPDSEYRAIRVEVDVSDYKIRARNGYRP